MSGRSVNLTTLFPGRLRPPKRLTSTSCTYFRQQLTTALLNQRKEKRKYVVRPGIEPRTSDLRVRCPTDDERLCANGTPFTSEKIFSYNGTRIRSRYISRSALHLSATAGPFKREQTDCGQTNHSCSLVCSLQMPFKWVKSCEKGMLRS